MGSRAYSRRPNGRFRRATLENTLGMSAPVCPNETCRRLNPYSLGELPPTHCHACGTALAPSSSEDSG